MDATYLFIDGSYAREVYRRNMEQVFGTHGDIMPGRIGNLVKPFRTFFYDCIDDSRKQNETDAAFAARVQAQEEYIANINSARSVHLRLGTLKGVRNRRQKEVDVLLAVDMLTHGFNHTMNRAILLAGDLDFRPIVETLVRAGIFVEVWSEKQSSAKELQWAADGSLTIDWHTTYQWSDQNFLDAHPMPQRVNHQRGMDMPVILRSGQLRKLHFNLMVDRRGGPFVVRMDDTMINQPCWFEHQNQDVLEKYLRVIYGPIEWTK